MSRSLADPGCKSCGGRGFLPTTGGVRKCKCLVDAVRRASLVAAGISRGIAAKDPAEIAAVIPEKVRVFLGEILRGDIWIIAPRSDLLRERMIVFASLASPMYLLSGLTLSRLIDSRFDREDRAVVDEIVTTPRTLILAIDDVGDHKKIPSVMEEVVSRRRDSGSPTIYATDVDITRHVGRYGPGVCQFFESFKKKIRVKGGPTVCFREAD